MTKKDFELIATVIQKVREDLWDVRPDRVGEYVSAAFATVLAETNPRFNRDRFLRACVPGANVRVRS